MRRAIWLIGLAVLCGSAAIAVSAQTKPSSPASAAVNDFKSSAAYAELRLRRAEVESELESLLMEYTDEHPKVKEAKTLVGLIQKETERLQAASSRGSQRLTTALGKLMVRKVELDADYQLLLETLQPTHPDAKRAKKKVEIFEAGIKDILGQ